MSPSTFLLGCFGWGFFCMQSVFASSCASDAVWGKAWALCGWHGLVTQVWTSPCALVCEFYLFPFLFLDRALGALLCSEHHIAASPHSLQSGLSNLLSLTNSDCLLQLMWDFSISPTIPFFHSEISYQEFISPEM